MRQARIALASVLAVAATSLCLSAPSLAATFVVTTSADSGAGSLYDAITSANSLPGTDVITFAIPGAGVHTITTTSILPLPPITGRLTIDGTTQDVEGSRWDTNIREKPRPVIEIRGSCFCGGLEVSATGAGSVIRGLSINGFGTWQILAHHGVTISDSLVGVTPDGTAGSGFGYAIESHSGNVIHNNVISSNSGSALRMTGGDNEVKGNFIGTNADGTAPVGLAGGIDLLGSAAPGHPNLIGGVNPTPTSACTGDCNLIAGNAVSFWVGAAESAIITGNFVGYDVTGSASLHGGGIQVRGDGITATLVRIGGTTPGERNVIRGYPYAVWLDHTRETSITGNFIGTDAAGHVGLNSEGAGILIGSDSTDVSVGGGVGALAVCTGACNLISGNGYPGVIIDPGATRNSVRGNFVGPTIDGDPGVGNSGGMWIRGGFGNVVADNRVAFNSVAGLVVTDSNAVANELTRNSVFANGGLGIDLSCTWPFCTSVTPNDSGDSDTGPNQLQNFPVISTVFVHDGKTTVTGMLPSASGQQYRIEFFQNAPIPSVTTTACSTLAYGEGQTYVDSAVVAPNTAFSVELPIALAPNEAITATATDAAGNTSEFSECQADLSITKRDDVDPVAPGESVTYTVEVTNHGPAPAPNVVVWDQRPALSQLADLPPMPLPSQGTCAPLDAFGRWRCDLGELARDATASIKVALAPRGSVTSLTNVAWVGDTSIFDPSLLKPVLAHDPDGGNNRAEQTTDVSTSTARVVVRKLTIPANDSTAFAFTGDLSGQASTGNDLTVSVVPGAYTTAETPSPGWDLASVTCDDADSTFDPSTGVVTFRAAAHETVACTFTNRRRGNVAVYKTVAGLPLAADQSFMFQLRANASRVSDGTILSSIAASGGNGGNVSFPLFPSDRSYQLCEVVSPVWIASLADSFSPPSGDVVCTSVMPGPGVQVTVPVDNLPARATLVVEKQTLPDGDPTQFELGGALTGTVADGDIRSALVAPGEHVVTESALAGWDLSSINCDDSDSTGDASVGAVHFRLAAGETVRCTLTNVKRGTIVVEKRTDPVGATGDFTFVGDASGKLFAAGQIVVPNLKPGTYFSSEMDPTPGGFTLSAIGCNDTNSTGDRLARTATFRLDPGETVVCAFTNTRTPSPPPDTKKPRCVISQSGVDAGHAFVRFTVQDLESGLARFKVYYIANATAQIPPFAVGTRDPIFVTVIDVDPAQPLGVTIYFWDVAGNRVTCDPVLASFLRDTGGPQPPSQTFRDLPDDESNITITNGQPGMQRFTLAVNGVKFKEGNLADAEIRQIDVSPVMLPGNENTITVTARGKKGSTATILIAN